jgi:hypothetical protein
VPQILQKGHVLNRFFEQRAKSAIAAVPFFGFGQIAWGSGYTEMVGGQPSVVETLPDDVDVITGQFHISNATYTYNELTDEVLVQASIPKNTLPGGSSSTWSTCYVLDREGGVIALVVQLPTPVTSTTGIAVEFILDCGRPVL